MARTATKRKAQVAIREQWCKGCGVCVAFCPLNVLRINDEGKAYEATDTCNSCRLCERLCPDFAIDVGEEDDAQPQA